MAQVPRLYDIGLLLALHAAFISEKIDTVESSFTSTINVKLELIMFNATVVTHPPVSYRDKDPRNGLPLGVSIPPQGNSNVSKYGDRWWLTGGQPYWGWKYVNVTHDYLSSEYNVTTGTCRYCATAIQDNQNYTRKKCPPTNFEMTIPSFTLNHDRIPFSILDIANLWSIRTNRTKLNIMMAGDSTMVDLFIVTICGVARHLGVKLLTKAMVNIRNGGLWGVNIMGQKFLLDNGVVVSFSLFKVYRGHMVLDELSKMCALHDIVIHNWGVRKPILLCCCLREAKKSNVQKLHYNRFMRNDEEYIKPMVKTLSALAKCHREFKTMIVHMSTVPQHFSQHPYGIFIKGNWSTETCVPIRVSAEIADIRSYLLRTQILPRVSLNMESNVQLVHPLFNDANEIALHDPINFYYLPIFDYFFEFFNIHPVRDRIAVLPGTDARQDCLHMLRYPSLATPFFDALYLLLLRDRGSAPYERAFSAALNDFRDENLQEMDRLHFRYSSRYDDFTGAYNRFLRYAGTS